MKGISAELAGRLKGSAANERVNTFGHIITYNVCYFGVIYCLIVTIVIGIIVVTGIAVIIVIIVAVIIVVATVVIVAVIEVAIIGRKIFAVLRSIVVLIRKGRSLVVISECLTFIFPG